MEEWGRLRGLRPVDWGEGEREHCLPAGRSRVPSFSSVEISFWGRLCSASLLGRVFLVVGGTGEVDDLGQRPANMYGKWGIGLVLKKTENRGVFGEGQGNRLMSWGDGSSWLCWEEEEEQIVMFSGRVGRVVVDDILDKLVGGREYVPYRTANERKIFTCPDDHWW